MSIEVKQADGHAVIVVDGVERYECSPGGTGPCWNIRETEDEANDFYIHVCDLDDFMAALKALRDSDAHRANVERWAP